MPAWASQALTAYVYLVLIVWPDRANPGLSYRSVEAVYNLVISGTVF